LESPCSLYERGTLTTTKSFALELVPKSPPTRREHPPPWFDAVRILIDGQDLATLLRRELLGPPQWIALAPSRHFLGNPDPELSCDGHPAVLVCHIDADPLCGFVTARIDIGERTVTWSDFAQINCQYDLDEWWAAEPIEAAAFEFDRREYAAALGFSDSIS
jgi:hypothetical protein